MLPIAPLMIEHRLMDRMLDLIGSELRLIKEKSMNVDFIEGVVDFYSTYVERCHHKKEEDTLFRKLGEKDISPEHRRMMDELIREHVLGRKIIERLAGAKVRFERDHNALREIENCLREISELSPAHIEKEDKRFFLPSMEYFDDQEKGNMLAEMDEFDKKLFHEIYKEIVEQFERKTGD